MLLEQEMKRSGGSFKSTVNRLLLTGLEAQHARKPKNRFVVKPLAMNLGLGTRYPKVADLIEAMEGVEHR